MWTIFTGISATYMGLTVIAVGSALPDGVTTLALSAKGYGDMAITGNYSSQCFGFLVGFGLAMLKKTITSGTQYFNLWDLDTLNSNALDVLAILTMLTVLCVSFFYGIARNYHFDKILGVVLLVIYGTFLIVATYFALAILLSGTTD
jgi:Ca2+/Na+ antiporter